MVGFCFLLTFLVLLLEFWGGREDGELIAGRILIDEVFEVMIGAAKELVISKEVLETLETTFENELEDDTVTQVVITGREI